MTDIVICVDGTWQSRESEHISNVLKIHRLNKGHSLYFKGVSGVWGGAFGGGAHRKRSAAYNALCAAWKPGDSIFIFGFSRGAAIGRMLAAKIAKEGVNGHSPDIEYLGIFDTVASFGLPGGYSSILEDFADLEIHPKVKRVRHAVAIDEDRKYAFPPTLVDPRDGIEEQWFSGGHSDIGGGNENRRSDIALKWIMDGSGLEFDAYEFDLNPDAPLFRADGWYRRGAREIPGGAVMHGSVRAK